jgi:hypothetical protein
VKAVTARQVRETGWNVKRIVAKCTFLHRTGEAIDQLGWLVFSSVGLAGINVREGIDITRQSRVDETKE